jgi:hypothetical protein
LNTHYTVAYSMISDITTETFVLKLEKPNPKIDAKLNFMTHL